MSQNTRHLHPTRDLTKNWRKGDAEKLATMENEAEAVWPGGGGWQTDPQELERWIRTGDLIGAFATEDGDRIVALCTLTAKPGQQEDSYVPHLICHPGYHGKKHGKSVLHAAVEYGYQAGFRKVDLHTWSGNMKAVPLYKKTGFMWQPESTVFMENFTPSARRHPLGAAYFAKHDWYDTLERSVELKEDLVTRGKVKVYEYQWRAENGDFLRMVFDRQSWRLIEIENHELLVACTLPDEKLVAGLPHPVRWKVENKKPAPVQIFLSASGDPGVEVSKREILELTGQTTIDGSFTIDPKIPEKTRDPRAALLNTEMIFAGTDLELCAGIGAQQAIDASLEVVRSLVACGRQKILLTLRSNLDAKAVVDLTVRPVHNAGVSRRSHQLILKPRTGAELPVELDIAGPGPIALDIETSVRSKGRKIPVKTQRIDLLAVEQNRPAAAIGENSAILYNGSLALFASRRHGVADVHYLPGGMRTQRLHLQRPQFGPPFSWDDLFQEKAEARIESDAQGLRLHLSSRSVLHPGLVLDRCIRLTQGPLVEVVDSLTNGSSRVLDLERLQGWGLNGKRGEYARFCAPRPEGTYADFPIPGGRSLHDFRLPEKGDQWPEGWLCQQGGDGLVSGILWDRAEVIEARRWGEMRQKIGRLKPGQTLTTTPLYLLVGDGDFQTVRRWWQLLFGQGMVEPEIDRETLHNPFELALTPNPLLLAGDRAQAKLSLRSPGNYRFDGKIGLQCAPPLRADIRSIDVSKLTVDTPVEQTVEICRTRKTATGPGTVALRFETDETIYKAQSNVFLLPPNPPAVEIEQNDDLITLANGILTAQVAPGFLGSVVSLRYKDREFLNSSYPEGGQRGWRNPWHGGLHPAYDRLWGQLHREKFRSRPVRRKGAQSLVWEGLRLTCKVEQEDARGHELFYEYLLAPGVDLLAVIVGRRDKLGTWSEEEAAFHIWPSFADAPGKATFHTPHHDRIVGRAAPHWSPDQFWKWGGLVGKKGDALFVGTGGAGTRAGGWAEGPEGCVLQGHLYLPLPAGKSVEGLFFVAPATDLEEAQSRAIWSEFTELP
jgi:ribosomal protein S18 acetylase RimI-like enzyme